MKLENCGRCGLEPVAFSDEDYKPHDRAACPACDDLTRIGRWNAAQFAARTERINAAAVAIAQAWCSPRNFGQFNEVGGYIESRCDEVNGEVVVVNAAALIDAQDAASRVRWAEMQGE